ncbi:MAG TPA: LysR family transcriptional regulator [Bacillota bacterium]|nr:LysR family transcriptional regulator [Bacillota bacterium]
MDLLQLQYFQVVARTENVTHAARELHVAQPSVSKAIARLEESLGVPLFERTGRRIHLNHFGEAFLRRVERCFHELEDGQRELSELAELERRTVTVGASTSQPLPDLFKEYLVRNPDVQFKIRHITKQREIQKRLLSGEIDLSIFFLPSAYPEIQCEPLLVEEIFLVVPPAHRLAGQKSVNLSDMAEETFIGVTRDSEFWEMTSRFCQQAGFTPNVAFEIESLDIVANLVNAGLGVAFLPAYWLRAVDMPAPVQLHIESPVCQRTIWLSWVKNRYSTEAVRHFREFTIRYFSS